MSLIEAYEEQYQGLVKSINEKLDRLAKLGQSSERWSSTVSSIEQDIEDSEEVLGKLEMEVRRVKTDAKLAIQTRVKQYRIDVGVCKETLEASLRRANPAAAAKAAAAASRDELFAGAGGSAGGEGGEHRINLTKSAEQRSRMATATGRLENSSERLKESRKIAQETELVGADIMQDLRQQRETLLHSRDSAREVEENLGASRRVLRAMARRMAQNKRIMYGVAFVVALIFVGLLALRLSPDSVATPTSAALSDPPPPIAPPSAAGTDGGGGGGPAGGRDSASAAAAAAAAGGGGWTTTTAAAAADSTPPSAEWTATGTAASTAADTAASTAAGTAATTTDVPAAPAEGNWTAAQDTVTPSA